jgi:Na+-translocating ferredoxin:NAD+ oxidoreductase subunit B
MLSVEHIDALLPQTQCTRCGYSGCRPYAEAIASGAADINQCPPGGAATIAALAKLLGRPALPLNPAHGVESPPLVAQIDEAACIGCARCLPPCPVDAILGAPKRMHTVIVALCTGCELCVAPCPVDCIAMLPRASLSAAPRAPASPENRERFDAHTARAAGRARKRAALLTERKSSGQSAAEP